MRTDDLITSLAADTSALSPPLRQSVVGGLICAVLAASIIFFSVSGPRIDFGAALGTWRFDFKLLLVAASVPVTAFVCVRMGRPLPSTTWPFAVLLAGLLAAAVSFELAVTPSDTWFPNWRGTNALLCLVAIPALSVLPLLILLLSLRSAAPASPARAGAAAGAASAAIGAALYATHCFDDSPLFVATWYVLGALPVVMLGAMMGKRYLRW